MSLITDFHPVPIVPAFLCHRDYINDFVMGEANPLHPNYVSWEQAIDRTAEPISAWLNTPNNEGPVSQEVQLTIGNVLSDRYGTTPNRYHGGGLWV